jgi:protein-S-isoprenylcysteine O-methyltransferase Ste14
MSYLPTFQIGFLNAWLFIVPYLFVTYGLSLFVVDRKAALFIWPEYTDVEKRVMPISMSVLLLLVIYSIFLPLKFGTMWFYLGLVIYLLGMLILLLATFGFSNTSIDKPVTAGVFRYSRNPMYLSFLLIYVGTGIASASWLVLVFALVIAVLQNYYMIPPEERMCLKKFGDRYQTYMDRTPKWIGIPK